MNKNWIKYSTETVLKLYNYFFSLRKEETLFLKINLLSFSLPDVLGRLITAKYEKKSFKETTDKAGKFRCDPRYSVFFFFRLNMVS